MTDRRRERPFQLKTSPEQVAVKVQPARHAIDRFAHEAAAFVQAHGAAAHAVAGDELDLGRVGPGDPVAAHLQAQPLGAGLESRATPGGAPGCQVASR
jgi:hypothetical protein